MPPETSLVKFLATDTGFTLDKSERDVDAFQEMEGLKQCKVDFVRQSLIKAKS